MEVRLLSGVLWMLRIAAIASDCRSDGPSPSEVRVLQHPLLRGILEYKQECGLTLLLSINSGHSMQVWWKWNTRTP